MKKRWKPWIWVAVAVVIVAAVLLGVGLGVGFGGEEATGITYRETVVSIGTVSQTVFGSGTLAPPEQHEVRAAAGGTVTSISVEEGQLVVPGQELFRIDGAPVYALGGDYAFYRTIRSSSDEGDDVVALQTLLANLGFFTRDIDGEYCWYSQEAVRDFLEAQDEDRTSRVGPDTFQTVGTGSPRVLSLQVSVGEVVSSDQTVMVTAPDGPMEAEVLVNELDIRLVEAGQRVELSVDALPSRLFSATVQARSYSPASETGSSGVVEYSVTVLLDDAAPELLLGMSVDAEIVVAEAVDALVVPATAIIERNGRQMVFVPVEADEDDGTAEDAPAMLGGLAPGITPGAGLAGLKVVPVEVGLWSESLVEIRSGLSEGQVIVAQIVMSSDTASESSRGGLLPIGGGPPPGGGPGAFGGAGGPPGGQR